LQILDLKSRQEEQHIEKEIKARRMRINAGPPSKLRTQVEAEITAKSDLGNIFETVLQDAESDANGGADVTAIQIKYFLFLKKLIVSDKDKNKVCPLITTIFIFFANLQVCKSLFEVSFNACL
jgi:superkiller protein 3